MKKAVTSDPDDLIVLMSLVRHHFSVCSSVWEKWRFRRKNAEAQPVVQSDFLPHIVTAPGEAKLTQTLLSTDLDVHRATIVSSANATC